MGQPPSTPKCAPQRPKHGTAGAFFCLLAACTEPSFDPWPDAALGPVDGALLDAGPGSTGSGPEAGQAGGPADAGGSGADAHDPAHLSPDATEPGSSDALLGRYVKRTIFFSRDDNGPGAIRVVETSVVDIGPGEAGTLVLRSKLCSLASNWVSDERTTLLVPDPSIVPELVASVVLDPDTGHLAAREAHRFAGYAPDRQTRCAGQPVGARVEAFDDQVWLADRRCTCAGSSGAPPNTPSDCRLDDPDGNGRPGITLSLNTVLGESRPSASFDAASALEFLALDPVAGQHTVRERALLSPACAGVPGEVCSMGTALPCGDVQSQWRRVGADANCGNFFSVGGETLGTIPQSTPGCDGS